MTIKIEIGIGKETNKLRMEEVRLNNIPIIFIIYCMCFVLELNMIIVPSL